MEIHGRQWNLNEFGQRVAPTTTRPLRIQNDIIVNFQMLTFDPRRAADWSGSFPQALAKRVADPRSSASTVDKASLCRRTI
jgi:hypothetical protein